MGKGDKKSARGKRAQGSYGNTRRRADNQKKTSISPVSANTEKDEVKKKPAPRKKAE